MKEDFTECISLKDLKENNPVEISEYVVSNNIDHDPEFLWWVPYTLQKRNPSISKLQKKYWRKKLRFGIEIPNSINRAYEIDEETQTDFWRKATVK